MASFKVKNPLGTAAILHAVDYLAKKLRQAEQKLGQPIEAVTSDFTDEHGTTWRLTFGPLETPAQPALPESQAEATE